MSECVSSPISAAVLTGGKSLRMGTDKALLEVGDQTILGRTLNVLGTLADDVLIVGEREEYHAFSAPVVADAFPVTGPLGGIATALMHARNSHVIVVGCDMPFLSRDLLAAMARLPRDFDVLVPLRADRSGKRYEPLHAIYSVQCLSVIRSAIHSGDYRLQNLLDTLQVQAVDDTFIRRFDPDQRSYINVNTPLDLQQARKERGWKR